jgi:hypothetical protein
LATLVFGGDGYVKDGRRIIPEPAALEVGMTEADFSNKGLGASGAIIISAWISHKDKGALTSLNLSSNDLKAAGAKAVAEAIKVTDCEIAVIFISI